MKVLENMKMKYKLGLMLSAPLLGLIYFAQAEVRDSLELRNELTGIERLAQFTVSSSTLVHELQKERGATAGFLGSGGKKFKADLSVQRGQTDKQIVELNTFLEDFDEASFGREFGGELADARKQLSALPEKRSAVSSMELSVKDAVGYYTNINGLFLELAGYLSRVSSVGEITNMSTAYAEFLQGKERAGIERAVMSNTFEKNAFGEGVFEKFVRLVTQQATYLGVFRNFATPESIEFYEQKMGDPQVAEVARMRVAAFTGNSKGAIVNDLHTEIGYGGLIHVFKNYVLRGNPKYIEAFDERYRGIVDALERYSKLAGNSDATKGDIETVRGVVDEYKQAMVNAS